MPFVFDGSLKRLADRVAALEALNGGAPGSATSATVVASGGSTARTLGARFADVVNVKDYGAKGDGTTDDTTAIAAAIVAATTAGKWLDFPAGTFSVTAEIPVYGKLRVRGAGPSATIITSSVASAAIFTVSSDLTSFVIRDLTLTTTRNNLVSRAAALLYNDTYSITGGLLENVTFDTGSSYSNGVLLSAPAGKTISALTVRDCYFAGPSAGLEILNHVGDSTQRVTGLQIVNNRFVNSGALNDQVAGFGISLSGPMRYVEIAGNDVRAYPYAGFEFVAGAAGSFAADYKIHHNIVTGTGRGILFDQGSAGTSVRISRVTVAHNTITGNTYFQRFQGLSESEIIGNHIEVVDGSTSSTRAADFVLFDYGDKNLVSENHINLDMPAAEETKAVIEVRNTTLSKFTGNHFRATGMIALWLQQTTTSNVFNGNTIDWNPNNNAYDVIRCDGAGVTGNLFADTFIPSTKATYYPNQVDSASGNFGTSTATVTAGVASVVVDGRLPYVALGQSGGGTKTPDLRYVVTKYQVTDNQNFTIANPTNAALGYQFTIIVDNIVGGAMGTITWGSGYRWAGGAAPSSPANQTRLIVTFTSDTQSYETARATAVSD